MPELPEVETVRSGLESLLADHPRISRVELIRGDLRRPVLAAELEVLENQIIHRVRRRAKYLLFDSGDHILLSHLGMTGSWRFAPLGEEKKHDHCYIHFADGRRLAFHDPRRFGLLTVIRRENELEHQTMAGLGPEPLDSRVFNAKWIYSRTRKRKTAIKIWLMDQRHVVGVGNIYASEALFLAGIRPKRLAHRTSEDDSRRLLKAVRTVLSRAIRHGGTTLRDYRQAGGGSGDYQQRLRVYGRNQQPCHKCHAPIQKAVIGGRSTFWCPRCQR